MPSVTYAGVNALSSNAHGFRRTRDNSLSDLSIVSNAAGRVEIGNFALSDEGDRTSAVLMGKGTSSTPVSIGSQGSKNFLGFWVEADQISGDVRGLYMRLFMGGASGASGEAARLFTTIKTGGVAAAAHGAHISLSFQTTGYASGLGIASRCTLHIPDQASWSTDGTYAPIQAEIFSDGAASDPANATELSYIRFSNGGHANGIADVDDDAQLFSIQGGTIGTDNLVEAAVAEASYSHNIKILVGSTQLYLMCANDRS